MIVTVTGDGGPTPLTGPFPATLARSLASLKGAGGSFLPTIPGPGPGPGPNPSSGIVATSNTGGAPHQITGDGRERLDYEYEYDHDDRKALSEFIDGIAEEQEQQQKKKKKKDEKESNSGGLGRGEVGEGGEDDEIEMMKKLGISIDFDSTKWKPVPCADVSGVRAKRQPRQYMNRRGGFNRPLPAEQNW